MCNSKWNASYNSNNAVINDGIIKELVLIEEEKSKIFESKWGFMKDLDKICVRVAANLGISEEEYIRMTRKKKIEKLSDANEWERKCKPSGPVPLTSSGFVGWRCKNPEQALEFCGPFYVSPRHTMEPPGEEKLPITNIILG